MESQFQKELKELYGSELTTDGIKLEAWSIRGISGDYFRKIVGGVKTTGKPFGDEDVLGCLNALKQAIKNDTVKRNEFNKMVQSIG